MVMTTGEWAAAWQPLAQTLGYLSEALAVHAGKMLSEELFNAVVPALEKIVEHGNCLSHMFSRIGHVS